MTEQERGEEHSESDSIPASASVSLTLTILSFLNLDLLILGECNTSYTVASLSRLLSYSTRAWLLAAPALAAA